MKMLQQRSLRVLLYSGISHHMKLNPYKITRARSAGGLSEREGCQTLLPEQIMHELVDLPGSQSTNPPLVTSQVGVSTQMYAG